MKLAICPCAFVSLCPCVEDALQKDGFVKFSVPLTSFTLQQASPAWHGEKTTLFWRRDKFAFPIPVWICNRMLWALPPRTTTCWVGTVERWNCNEIFAFDFSCLELGEVPNSFVVIVVEISIAIFLIEYHMIFNFPSFQTSVLKAFFVRSSSEVFIFCPNIQYVRVSSRIIKGGTAPHSE